MINFEGYSRRIDKINSVLGEYGIESLEAAQQLSLIHISEPTRH